MKKLSLTQRQMLDFINANGRTPDVHLMIRFGRSWRRTRNILARHNLISNSRAGWSVLEDDMDAENVGKYASDGEGEAGL